MIFNTIISTVTYQYSRSRKSNSDSFRQRHVSQKYQSATDISHKIQINHAIDQNEVLLQKYKQVKNIYMNFKTILNSLVNRRTTNGKLRFETIRTSPNKFSK